MFRIIFVIIIIEFIALLKVQAQCVPEVIIDNIYYHSSYIRVVYSSKKDCPKNDGVEFQVSANGLPLPRQLQTLFPIPKTGISAEALFPINIFKLQKGELVCLKAKVKSRPNSKIFKKYLVLKQKDSARNVSSSIPKSLKKLRVKSDDPLSL